MARPVSNRSRFIRNSTLKCQECPCLRLPIYYPLEPEGQKGATIDIEQALVLDPKADEAHGSKDFFVVDGGDYQAGIASLTDALN